MNNACAFLCGLAVGAGVMYLIDPQGGRRRRSLALDKLRSWGYQAEDFAEKKGRHLRNRALGLAHEARKAVGAES